MNMKILTPSGFQPFEGVARYWHDKSLKFIFEDGAVESAYDHRFIIDGKEVFARDVRIGDNIGKVVKDIIEISEGDYFYDPVNVLNGKIYNHDNGLVSHNTFFGTGDTLIDAEALMKLRSKDPISYREGGALKIYHEAEKNHEYIMTVDVSKGLSQDYSTFNIIDVSTRPFRQCATYKNNRISPLLFPNVIFKYATAYNEAYVIVESNDQGSLVTQGLYHELEYENLHVESAIRSDGLGILMSRKVKRIGCQGFKDVLETGRLEIYDNETIIECSTFEARGQSFEASPGNHDDLIMNLVMFGYFINTNHFGDLTDINMKELMYKQQMAEIEADVLPFGFTDDGLSDIPVEAPDNGNGRFGWSIQEVADPNF